MSFTIHIIIYIICESGEQKKKMYANEFWQRNVNKTMIYRGEPKSLLYFIIRKQLWPNLEAGPASEYTHRSHSECSKLNSNLEAVHLGAKSAPLPDCLSNCSNCNQRWLHNLGLLVSSAQLIFPQIDCVNGEQIKNKVVEKETKTKHLIEKNTFPTLHNLQGRGSKNRLG